MGFAGVGCALGDAVARRRGADAPSPFVALIVGLAIVWALTAMARFMGLVGESVAIPVGFLLAAGFIVEYVAWTVGLGAVLLSRFGRRAPAPPPAVVFEPEPPSLTV